MASKFNMTSATMSLSSYHCHMCVCLILQFLYSIKVSSCSTFWYNTTFTCFVTLYSFFCLLILVQRVFYIWAMDGVEDVAFKEVLQRVKINRAAGVDEVRVHTRRLVGENGMHWVYRQKKPSVGKEAQWLEKGKDSNFYKRGKRSRVCQ